MQGSISPTKNARLKPRRADNPTLYTLVLLSRSLDWRDALTIVRPGTFVGWHRNGFGFWWHWKWRAGRRPTPAERSGTIMFSAALKPHSVCGPPCYELENNFTLQLNLVI
jgi:hypothetical protein